MSRRHRRTARWTLAGLATLGAAVVAAAGFTTSVVMPGFVVGGNQMPVTLDATCGCTSVISAAGRSAWNVVGLALSLAVLAVTAGRGVLLLRRTRRLVSGIRLQPASRRLRRIADSIGLSRVYETLYSAPAFCAGWVQPYVVISTQTLARLDDHQVRAVLEHEQFHRLNRDPLKLLAVEVSTASLRLVPGVRRLIDEYRTAVELAADEAAVERMGDAQDLSWAIVKLVPQSARDSGHPVLAFFEITNRRIDYLLGVAAVRQPPGRLALAVVLGIGLAAVIAWFGWQAHQLQAKTATTVPGVCRELQRSCRASQSVPYQLPASSKSIEIQATLTSTPSR